MTRFSLMLCLTLPSALLAMPVMAATPHALPARAAPVAAQAGAEDLMRQAGAASAKGDKDLAIRLAQAAIVADPAKPQTYDLLADLYAEQGQSDFASFYYNEALGIDPSDAAATKAVAELNRDGNQQAAEATAPSK